MPEINSFSGYAESIRLNKGENIQLQIGKEV